ncbi:hypothetical protein [Azospirillum sp. TSH64]|uniref:hypothetical protein n=1 Tax=Azospirillum sp. TSH64 TaxID=652740 RepID=UPI000D605158|nr:hypothetical protein [Azospirillum sp. TSH64]PWC73913.1 hypothetical protein TSH64_01665 [Azospirillum sp. TSH64]PWC81418.1 hypothetical protein TSH64_00410 [Azospirillum sp. TSH64]
MSKIECAAGIFASASLHLDVVDEFIAITQSKLDGSTSDFTRDSLADLLAGLTEQRETYRSVLAAADPIVTALAA